MPPADQPPRPIRLGNKSIAVLLGLAAALCLSTQDLLVKKLSEELHIMQILFGRSLFAFAAVMLWIGFWGGIHQLRIHRPRLVSFRILCNMSAWLCYYIAVQFLPLPVYTAIGFTVFLLSALLSGPILKEPLSWREGLAAVAGLLGIILISNPTAHEGDLNLYAVALLLFGAFTWALSLVVTRALGTSMSPSSIMFYSNLGLLLLGGAAAPLVWQTHGSEIWLILACTGILSFLGQNMLINAVQLARVAVVTPTQYTMLLWASLYSWLIWGILPGGSLLLGALCIIGGSLLIIMKDKT